MSDTKQLNDWLHWQENLHPVAIDLGLTRVYQVAVRLGLLQAPAINDQHQSATLCSGTLAIDGTQVITVAGTNGKGSCVAVVEQCLLSQGFAVGTYTSPHLHHYCERIRIAGQPVAESAVCAAFAAIDAAREGVSLTFFEFGTLAALYLFVQAQLPYIVLEVGLGGRLDAVNIVDADVAVITSVDLDHQQWLGNDRDSIAREKLGIARRHRPLVMAETALTPSLQAALATHSVKLLGRDFHLLTAGEHDNFHCDGESYPLPKVDLASTSVAAALMALRVIERLPPAAQLANSVADSSLPGRFERQTRQQRQFIFDVAHNPAAARLLSQRLQQHPCEGATLAVFATMADKDYGGLIEPLQALIDRWYIAGFADNHRALDALTLRNALVARKQCVQDFASVEAAAAAALAAAGTHDRIVVFGSFLTVAAVRFG
ncbi:MAG: bifunctional tetrahydrofolate synthase/dihydrofolate synthase [Cellvibrionaceae bacterium]|nr:bifunctional tetrahydrofolate synthase/dihydrofolate synthase [Cellvibrionaceae bacterium]